MTRRGECLTPKIVELCIAKLDGKMLFFPTNGWLHLGRSWHWHCFCG